MIHLFKKEKEDFEDLEQYEEMMDEEIESYGEDIPEIIETYSADYESELDYIPLEEDFEEYEEETKKERNVSRLILNIIFGLVLLIGVLVTIDIVSISRFERGPYFAIPVKTYEDGGTKEYLGIGYKVIKYHQNYGRRDMEIGTWKLKYSTEPVEISDLDFAIEYVNDSEATARIYNHLFVSMTSTIKKVDLENNRLTLEYFDEDGKYTLELNCEMAEKKNNLNTLKEGSKVNIIGTMKEFKVNPNSITLTGCFAEEMIEVIEE